MFITFPAGRTVTEGVRPVDLRRDVPQVVNLLRIAFAESNDMDERLAFRQASANPELLWRLGNASSRLGDGFVWVMGNKVIGNATLLPTHIKGRYLVVNVAVHPYYRRRGIAAALMQAVEESVRARKGHVILLQVVQGNTPAVNLYRSIGYRPLGTMATWVAPVSWLAQIPTTVNGEEPPDIRELPGSWWRQAYELDVTCLSPDLNWPEPLTTDAYRRSFVGRMSDFFNARQREYWAITGEDGRLSGLAAIGSESLRSNTLAIRVAATQHGQLERPLLAKAIRRLSSSSHGNVRIVHPQQDEIVNDLLQEAGFFYQRSLTHMRYDLS